ncbi:MAG: UbiX family flavin prenyltransferase [Alphaproteobacteria bacterium]|nr:UbiX family flavin prenyltransferase [Alphaproteobacteria bacterium]
MKRIIVGISGASGAVYGVRALEMLKAMDDVETHLVVTRAAEKTIHFELSMDPMDVRRLADAHYDVEDVGAAIASGSFEAAGMLVAPCSVHSLAAIANSLADNLLVRAADVTLKERRRLALMVRESPLHLGHIRAMQGVTEMGGVIAPPVPAFYTRPGSLEDVINQTVARSLELVGVDPGDYLKRWGQTNCRYC